MLPLNLDDRQFVTKDIRILFSILPYNSGLNFQVQPTYMCIGFSYGRPVATGSAQIVVVLMALISLLINEVVSKRELSTAH